MPADILKNTEAFLALLSALLCVAGVFLTLTLYAALYLSIGYVESSIIPQIDSAQAALLSASDSVSAVANSTSTASQSLVSLSDSFIHYSDSAKNISESLNSISAVPPFSLDARFASAAKSFRVGTFYFQNASTALKQAAHSASGASAAIKGTRDDIDAAQSSLSTTKNGLKNAFFMLNIAAIIVTLSLLLLFFSVLSVSFSILLSHYPRLLEKGERQEKARQSDAPQGREEPGRRDFSVSERPNVEKYYPPGYREWKPGQGGRAKSG